MAENENTPLPGTKEIESSLPSQEITDEMLEKKIIELGVMEKKIFSSDGKIGGESHDSIIDTRYNEIILQAENSQKKISLVGNLIEEINIHYAFENEKQSEYRDNEDKNTIDVIKIKEKEFIQKYPKYEHSIELFFKTKFDRNAFIVDYYDPKNTPENLLATQLFLKENYKNLLNNSFKEIEHAINSIEGEKQISDGPIFLNYLLNNNVSLYQLKEKLTFLFGLEIVKKGFSDNEKSSEFEETFGYGTLSEFIQMPNEKLLQINTLFKNKKAHELTTYIDSSLSLEQKEKLFAFKKIKNMYIEGKKSEFTGNTNLSDEILISFGNIKNFNLRNRIKDIILNYTSAYPNQKRITSFFDENMEFDDLVKTADIKDKFFALDTFQKLIIEIDGTILCTPFHTEISNKINARLEKYQKEEIQSINNAIVELQEKYKGDTEKYYQIKQNVKNANNNPKELLHILDKDYTISEKIEPKQKESPQEETQLLRPEIQKLEGRMQNQGLGKKFRLDENGKMVSKEYLEKKQKAITEGKPLPPKDNTEESVNIGRNGQIKYGINGEMLFTSSLGYTFHLDNNIYGVQKALDINDTFDYMDKIGLGYFGDNLANMAETIKTVFGNEFANVSLGELSFLKPEKTRNFIDMFKKIGFISEDQSIERHNVTAIHDMKMTGRLKGLDVKNKSVGTPGGNAFSKGTSYDAMNFRRFVTGIRDNGLVQNSNKV